MTHLDLLDLTAGPPYSDDQLIAVLESVSKIAVVGASANPQKPAHNVPKTLLETGFEMIPVNPTAHDILQQVTYPTLAEIPQDVDMVNVFRPSEDAPAIAEQAVAIGAKVFWLQLGLSSIEAREIAEGAGLIYLENVCIGATVKRLNFRK